MNNYFDYLPDEIVSFILVECIDENKCAHKFSLACKRFDRIFESEKDKLIKKFTIVSKTYKIIDEEYPFLVEYSHSKLPDGTFHGNNIVTTFRSIYAKRITKVPNDIELHSQFAICIRQQINYVFGERNGIFQRLDNRGSFVTIITRNYVDNKMRSETVMTNGKIVEAKEYNASGRIHGWRLEWSVHYPMLIMCVEYRNGKKHGRSLVQDLDNSGNITIVQDCEYRNGKKVASEKI